MPAMDDAQLGKILETLYQRYRRDFLPTDPLQFVHRYTKPQDREVVALLSSALAYGNVKQIAATMERLLPLLGKSPGRFVRRFDPQKNMASLLPLKHRFSTGRDIACLLYFLRQVYNQFATLEDLFLEGYSADMKESLSCFVNRMLALDSKPVYGRSTLAKNAGVRYFLCAPSNGSACKRLCLFLRWMVRRDDTVDLGQWTRVSPAHLIYPVDTHIATISRHLGLTERKTASWAMAEEITDCLRRIDPGDPVRFDFALTRLGILDLVRSRNGVIQCDEPLLNER
jgi:uncharacterized protein (TIGR02757 family)